MTEINVNEPILETLEDLKRVRDDKGKFVGIKKEKPTDLLTVAELCVILGINRDTVYRELKAGSLPGFRVGVKIWRFRRSDITAWIDKRRGA